MKYAINLAVLTMVQNITPVALADESDTGFTEEELSVAKFWEDMGPTLRDHGLEAYAIRYHADFRNWDIAGSGRMATKENAVRYWTKFHEDGHRITCTHVEPVTIDVVGDRAFARLVYEQTDTYADGRVTTGVWRMVDIFQRYEDTWQVLESTMVDITPSADAMSDEPAAEKIERNCPAAAE